MAPALASLGLLLTMASIPAAAATPVTMPALKACQADRDPALCALRLVKAASGGRVILDDEELSARPGLQAAVGVTRASVLAEEAQADDAVRMFRQAEDRADEALELAFAAAKSNASVETVLAPLDALSDEPPRVPPYFRQLDPLTPRLLAYSKLAALAPIEAPGRMDVRDTALHRWEATLRARGGSSNPNTNLAQLARAYRLAGDESGVSRAAAIGSDAQRLLTLIAVGRLDEAAALARVASTAQAEAAAEARMRVEASQAEANRREVDAFQEKLLQEKTAELRAAGHADQADALELMLRQSPVDEDEAAAAPAGAEHDLAADAKSEARENLDSALIALLRAEVETGRADLARDLADRLLGGSSALMVTPLVAKAASPAGATAWLERLEAAIGPASKKAYADPDALTLFRAAASGWLALGRGERVDALIARWLPTVRADLAKPAARPGERSPLAWSIVRAMVMRGQTEQARRLINEIASSSGPDLVISGQTDQARRAWRAAVEDDLIVAELEQDRFDEFDNGLRRARSENEVLQVFSACHNATIEGGAAGLELDCAIHGRPFATTPRQRAALVELAASALGPAARGDDLGLALKALDVGAELSDGADVDDGPVSSVGSAALELAKGQLRADGRLPRRNSKPGAALP